MTWRKNLLVISWNYRFSTKGFRPGKFKSSSGTSKSTANTDKLNAVSLQEMELILPRHWWVGSFVGLVCNQVRDLYFQSIEPIADNSKWILCVNRSFNKFQTRKTLKTNSRDTESKGKCPNQTFIAKILNEKKTRHWTNRAVFDSSFAFASSLQVNHGGEGKVSKTKYLTSRTKAQHALS